MQKNIVRRPFHEDTSSLSEFHPVLRQIYLNRGIANAEQLKRSAASLQHFSSMQGLEKAAQLLVDAIAAQKRIVICGDFDADGATSTAVMIRGLKKFGAQHVDFLVPNRFEYGYGLTPPLVDEVKQLNADVIVTVDNGISSLDGVAAAKDAGLTVIVTDHHLPGSALPSADAIVNPNLPDCGFPSKALAGVGVAFYLLIAMRDRLQQMQALPSPAPNVAELLDLVALGTVADVVPLDDNNRILVHQGLMRIRAGRCCPGIKALIDVAGKNQVELSATDFGFALGPRLNAAGRLDDMALGISCLLTDDVYQAKRIAEQLDSLNRERREIEQSMVNDAETILARLTLDPEQLPSAICLHRSDFHEGVVGIVAGRVKEKWHRPAVVFADADNAQLKGSCRSIPGLHIRDVLELVNSRHPGMIIKFGGHAMAAGLSIKASQLPAFEQALQQAVSEMLSEDMLQGVILSDGALATDCMTQEFAVLLRESGPWGQQFDAPVFDDEFELIQQRIVGQKHLKVVLQKDGLALDGIIFNVDVRRWPDPMVRKVHCAYKLDINEFRGNKNLQLLIDHIDAR